MSLLRIKRNDPNGAVESAQFVCKVLSINHSGIRYKRFWDTLQKILSVSELDPYCLELDLPESSIMSDPQATIVLLEKIHQLGVRIAVDDFGTGCSSLTYLKRLPIDT